MKKFSFIALGLVALGLVFFAAHAAVTKTFVSSGGEKSTYTYALTANLDTSGIHDISGASWVGISSKGITADTISVQVSVLPAPTAAAEWFTLTDNSGVNPFAADNNLWQQSVVGMRALRFVRAGAADGTITMQLTLKK
jgi:hypothetical protein